MALASRKRTAAFVALQLYLEDPDVALVDVWRHGRMDADPNAPLINELVSIEDLRKIATAEQWGKKKERFWAEIQARVLSEAQTKIIDREIREIDQLEQVSARLLAAALREGDQALKVGSLESATRALVALDEHLGKKRDRVARQVAAAVISKVPQPLTGDTTAPARVVPEIEDGITEAEVQQLARQLALSRVEAGQEDNDV